MPSLSSHSLSIQNIFQHWFSVNVLNKAFRAIFSKEDIKYLQCAKDILRHWKTDFHMRKTSSSAGKTSSSVRKSSSIICLLLHNHMPQGSHHTRLPTLYSLHYTTLYTALFSPLNTELNAELNNVLKAVQTSVLHYSVSLESSLGTISPPVPTVAETQSEKYQTNAN